MLGSLPNHPDFAYVHSLPNRNNFATFCEAHRYRVVDSSPCQLWELGPGYGVKLQVTNERDLESNLYMVDISLESGANFLLRENEEPITGQLALPGPGAVEKPGALERHKQARDRRRSTNLEYKKRKSLRRRLVPYVIVAGLVSAALGSL